MRRVQLAVGVLLERVEPGGVVLPPVAGRVAEQACAEVRVGEDEAAEVRDERLDARPEGDEVELRREVGQLRFGERLLQREVLPASGAALPHVDVDEVPLPDAQVVQVEGGRALYGEALGPERRLALEQLGRHEGPRRRERLVASAEELPAPRIERAHSARRGQPPPLERRLQDAGQDEEDRIADDGLVALEDVLVVGVDVAPLHEARVFGIGDVPPVRHGGELGRPRGHRRDRGRGRRLNRRGRRGRGGRRRRWLEAGDALEGRRHDVRFGQRERFALRGLEQHQAAPAGEPRDGDLPPVLEHQYLRLGLRRRLRRAVARDRLERRRDDVSLGDREDLALRGLEHDLAVAADEPGDGDPAPVLQDEDLIGADERRQGEDGQHGGPAADRSHRSGWRGNLTQGRRTPRTTSRSQRFSAGASKPAAPADAMRSSWSTPSPLTPTAPTRVSFL